MAVRVGVGLFTGQVPADTSRTFAQEYGEMLELVRVAESAGFDSAWVSEHHGASDGYLPSLLPMLAAFAASTETILLGTGIVLAPFHDPLRLAEDAAVVDQLSGGRLLLGLGIAWREEEFRMFGVPRSERAVRTEETIEILRRAWTGRRFSFEGRAFRYDRVKVTPPPARASGIPVYLGGYADKAVRRAGRLADGYITDAEPQDAQRYTALVDESARGAGREPDALALVLLRNAFVQADGDAWETVKGGVAHQLGAYDAWEAGADTPDTDSLTFAPPQVAALRRNTSAGSPAEVRDGLKEILAPFSGRSDVHLVVRLHYPGMDLDTASRALDLFATEVMPSLKEA
jgi:probable F420-dependent oxidoreductase